MSHPRLPTYFLSHGGGPWPWIMDQMPGFENLERSLKNILAQLPMRPEAVLVMSGHWEESDFTLMSIIGSGSSYHNLRLPKDRIEHSRTFDRWLQDKVLSATGEDRNADLIDWEKAPAARSAHPQEDHLMPLMFAVGAAENETASLIYHEMLVNFFFVSSFKLGQEKGVNFTTQT